MVRRRAESKQGFTFIEVVMVLAVAGLIMITVFAAFPAIQRLERDSERREDMATIIDAIKRYQTNNRGALPEQSADAWKSFGKAYLNNLADPIAPVDNAGNLIKYVDRIDISMCGGDATGSDCNTQISSSFTSNDYRLHVVYNATCNDESRPVKSKNVRKVALIYTLEATGLVCRDT